MLLALLTAAPAAAQGRSVGAESPAIYLGSWLDDASVVAPGALWGGVSFGYWRLDLARQIDGPVFDMALGAAPHVHIGASVPVYHFNDGAGSTSSGLGRVYLYGKVQLRDAAKSDGRVGVAVTPILEIVNDTQTERRVSWAAPISLEVRHGSARVYGSAGYFSRGALFFSAALESLLAPRLIVTGTIGSTYSTGKEGPIALLRDARSRTDLGLSAAVPLTPALAIFGAAGHSFSASVEVGGGKWFAGGISVLIAGIR